MRFVHTSDWQLGMTRHFLEGEAQARFTAARIDAIRAIGEVVRRENADMVVVAGDVFDSNLVAPATVHRSFDALRSIGVPVYLLAGNHDALNAVSIYGSPVWASHAPGNVHVLQPGLNATECGVEIVAAPLPSNDPRADLLGQQLAQLEGPGELPRIAVGHGIVDEVEPDSTNPATMSLARMEEAIASGAVAYVALGDRHSRLSLGTTGRVHYSGAAEVTDFRERLPGDVLVVDLDSDQRVEVSAVHVGTWRFVTVSAELYGDDDLNILEQRLAELDPKDRIVVRTRLVGTLTLAQKARLDALTERFGEAFAGFFSWRRHEDVAVTVDGADVESMNVSGFVESAARELECTAATAAPPAPDEPPEPATDNAQARYEALEAAYQESLREPEPAKTAADSLSLLFRLTAGESR